MSATTFEAAELLARHAHTVRHVRRGWMITVGGLLAVLVYLTYAWTAFDISGLIANAEPERAVLLGTDAVAHKVHITKGLRRQGDFEVAIEGERTATYGQQPDRPYPAWVRADPEGRHVDIDLGGGYRATIDGDVTTLTVPDYGTIRVWIEGGEVLADLPEGPVPDWIRHARHPTSDLLIKFDARPTIGRRVQVTRSKIEVHRYFLGWENFFFPFRSPLHGMSPAALAALVTVEPRLDPALPNWQLILKTFWDNPEWQHGVIAVALFETILMAVLGTFTAALVGLPLAFLAARTFNKIGPIRFFLRRLFDFLRGIDMLIWSLIFIRAFGLGPLTGALAIAFTDTGTLGKLFSEALENIDRKQEEGVQSTGANFFQRTRFGVIPQILPVFVSQGLYYLESNTRSATVIGALGAGGIGLVLVETMRTSRDWENTLYIIILTVMVVMTMDALSSWLRRRLIQGASGAP
ncbi:phosphonate ABC transporter, permease protein PhnE [Roseospirillum parvum]|uniref:Phosphonate transport system permease protein n=1 Tax=Roseospirillum parvum TaxID=83401 RepID=A0A1G8ARR1_9PROT|nr:phosphonate ABC transporter, permease protein PhnE [Roseospirillum parvum]SDH23416.1 phosphonate transport system permease protein [Roseospirillum parvum]